MNAIQLHKPRSRTLLASVLATLLSLPAVQAAEQAPRLQFVQGEVFAIAADGAQRPVRKGDRLAPGEKLVTGEAGMAQLRVFDQGLVSLREETTVKVLPAKQGRFGLSLDKGQIRTLTDMPDAKGRIDVATRQGGFSVRGGDMQTAINKTEQGGESVVSRALAGEVKITARGVERTVVQGKVVRLAKSGAEIKVLDKVPEGLKLRMPVAVGKTRQDAARPPVSTGKLAPVSLTQEKPAAPGILPGIATANLRKPVPTVNPRVAAAAPKKTYHFEVSRVAVDAADPNLTAGQKAALKDTFLININSNTTRTPTLAPVKPSQPGALSKLNKRSSSTLNVKGTGSGGVSISTPAGRGGPNVPKTGTVTSGGLNLRR